MRGGSEVTNALVESNESKHIVSKVSEFVCTKEEEDDDDCNCYAVAIV